MEVWTIAQGSLLRCFHMVDEENNSMVELKKIDDGGSTKVMMWEIYKSFFEINKISPSFIDANFTFDVVNEDTGKKIWPFGTVSEVSNESLWIFVIFSLQLKSWC